METPQEPLRRRTPISMRDDGAEQAAVPEPAKPSKPPTAQARNVGLMAFGIPGTVALLGVLSLVFWLRAVPQVSEIEPRLPSATSQEAADSTDPRPLPEGACPATSAQGATGDASLPTAGDTNLPGMPPLMDDVGLPGPGGGGDASLPSPEPDRPNSGGGMGLPAPSAPSSPMSASVPGSWPRFRGANFDNISTESGFLRGAWPGSGPRKLWSVTLGEGHAGAAVANGRVYVLDYDQNAKADRLRCLSFADGKELWSQSYPVLIKRNHGMSRTVPAVSGSSVVTIGPKCHVMCADATSGAVRWRKDLVAEYGTKVPTWYAGQCPLIDGNKVIVAPGGKSLMVAFDIASGKVAWQSPNPRKWQMTHSSIVPATIGGKKQYIYCASGGVAGVSASDGSVLWEFPDWTVSTANIPAPIPIGDGRIFLCGGYNAGAMMIRVANSGGKFQASKVFALQSKVFGSDQQTPILYNNHIYGVIPGGQMACLDLNGKQLWTSGSTNRFGIGPYVIAGGLMYALADKGDLALVQPNPQSYKQLAKTKILNGSDAWGPIAVAGGRLIARDLTTMVCLDVSGG